MRLLILFISILLLSCNKEKRVEPEYFVGEWEWAYSIRYQVLYDHRDQPSGRKVLDTIYPNDKEFNWTASINIKSSGNVLFYLNGKLKTRIPAKHLVYDTRDIYKYTSVEYANGNSGYYNKFNIYEQYNSNSTSLVFGFPFSDDYDYDYANNTISDAAAISESNDSLVISNFFSRK